MGNVHPVFPDQPIIFGANTEKPVQNETGTTPEELPRENEESPLQDEPEIGVLGLDGLDPEQAAEIERLQDEAYNRVMRMTFIILTIVLCIQVFGKLPFLTILGPLF